jgi:hypothetical protein
MFVHSNSKHTNRNILINKFNLFIYYYAIICILSLCNLKYHKNLVGNFRLQFEVTKTHNSRWYEVLMFISKYPIPHELSQPFHGKMNE